MKKKITKLIFIILSIFTLTACSSSLHDELQENDWIVNQDDGLSGEVKFGSSNMSMSNGVLSISYEYSLNDDESEITMTDSSSDEKETQTFEIEKEKKEIIFIPKETTDETGETLPTMTLIPKKEE